jgi:2-polyprenyl-3-methyl-5-hydroxy-6-metoxy-1,4-benzoquinol methylase
MVRWVEGTHNLPGEKLERSNFLIHSKFDVVIEAKIVKHVEHPHR